MSLQGTGSTVSALCPAEASRTDRSLSSPLSHRASASCGTPGSQPSAGRSAPVDTRGENTNTLQNTLAPRYGRRPRLER